jgi:hypothetical protein
VAKANNLEIEVVETNTDKPTEEYLKYNALSKVPTFVGADGYVLSECIAIAVYGTCSHWEGVTGRPAAAPLSSVSHTGVLLLT